MAKKLEVRNCIHCGRDTRTLFQICQACSGGFSVIGKGRGRVGASLREQAALKEMEYLREIDEQGFTDRGSGGDDDNNTDPKC